MRIFGVIHLLLLDLHPNGTIVYDHGYDELNEYDDMLNCDQDEYVSDVAPRTFKLMYIYIPMRLFNCPKLVVPMTRQFMNVAA
jgi:hypothetical protein